MRLTSLALLYVILPVALAVYIPLPRRLRPVWLLAVSLAYYALVAPGFLYLLLLSVLADFLILRIMDRCDSLRLLRAILLGVCAVKNLGMILCNTLRAQSPQVTVMAGTAILCLSGLDCVWGAWRREYPCERNIIRFSLYCCFFPRLQAGPLMRYDAFARQLRDPAPKPAKMLEGAAGILFGVVKFQFFGTALAGIGQTLRHYGAGEASVLSGWCMVITLALSVYYQFSGICDIARGIGLLFGLELPKNFYYPYQARSVQDFFERFNASYYSFLRRTVYAGLREDQNGLPADILNTLMVGMLFGLWFQLGPNKLLWGAFLAVFALLERYLYPALLRGLPTLFARAYTFVVVMVSFALYVGESLPQSAGYLKVLFGLGVPLQNNRILYFLSNSWPFLLVSCFLATSILSLADIALRKTSGRLWAAVLTPVCAGLLLLSAALLV